MLREGAPCSPAGARRGRAPLGTGLAPPCLCKPGRNEDRRWAAERRRERPSVVKLSQEVVAHIRGDCEAHFGSHLAGVPEMHATPDAAVNDSLNRSPERRV